MTGCVRYQTDTAYDDVYVCADAINSGTWGYNNLQWYGMTWYHKFTEKFHVAFEAYTLSQRNVLNITDPAGIIAGGGYPFAPGIIQFNAPNFAHCSDPNAITCTARVVTALAYWNYKVTPLDNISLRTEYYHDEEGQRTGTPTRLCRRGPRVAALVLAADRDASGSDLLQVLQRAGLQRQFQCYAGPDPDEQILHVVVRGGHNLAFLTGGTGNERGGVLRG